MEFLIECLKWIDRRMIAIATVVLVGITWRYVRLTRDSVQLARDTLEENRQMRLDAQKPKIAVYSGEKYEALGRPNEAQSLFLCVENVSTGPAYDVNLELTDLSFSLPTRHGSEVRLLKDIPLIAHGISYLPPGHDRSYCLSNAHEYGQHNELAQSQVQIKVTYKGFRRETYNDCIDVDFRIRASR